MALIFFISHKTLSQNIPDIKIPTYPKIDYKLPSINETLKISRPPKKELLPFKLKKTSIHSFLKSEYKIDTSSFKNSSTYFKKRMDSKWSFIKTFYKKQTDTVSHAKKIPEFLIFNGGQVILEQQNSHREGHYPNSTPANFTRFSANFGVSVFKIPLKIQALQTTEQDTTLRQPMNRISASFDAMAWRNQVSHYVEDQLREVEKQLGVPELKNLDKLYKYYDRNKIKFLNGKDLQKQIEGYLASKAYDSLDKLTPGIEKKVRKKTSDIETKVNKKAKKIELKIEAKSKDLKEKAESSYDKVQNTKTKKISKSKNRRLKKFMDKNNTDAADLKRLQHLYDSVKKINPEKLELYETYMVLKSLKGGPTSEAYQYLKNKHLISTPDILASSIKTLTFGTSFPTYTDYTLKGLPLKGVNAEVQMGKLYLAYAGSNNLQKVGSTNTYGRKIWVARTGLGTSEGNHMHLTFLKGEDLSSNKRDTSLIGQVDTSFVGKPHQNYVVDLHGRLLLSNKIDVEIEAAESVTNLNGQLRKLNNNELSTYFLRTGLPDANIRSGLAYNTKLNFKFNTSTSVSFKLLHIDADFYSMGIPFIRNNQNGYELSFEQKLFKNHIVLKPSYGHFQSINGNKAIINNYALNSRFSFNNLPQISIDYKEQNLTGSLLNHLKVFMINAGYSFKWGKQSCNTNINYLVQENKTNLKTPIVIVDPNLKPTLGAEYMRIYTLQGTITFSFPLQVTGNLSIRNIDGGIETGNWKIFSFESNYTAFGIWQNGFGVSYGNTTLSDSKQNYYFTSSAKFLKRFTFKIRLENNKFNSGHANNSYSETKAVGGILYAFK